MKIIFFLLNFILYAFLSVQCAKITHRFSKLTANKPDSVNFVWTNTIANATCIGIAVDAKGNSYIAGDFGRTATFDAIKLKALGVSDVFIAKYDPNGYCVWAIHAGSLIHNSQSYVYGITADADGNSYITGCTYGSVVFDTISLYAPFENGNIFTAKYSPEGKCLWARLDLAGGYNFDQGKGIAVDSHGNCYITGSFEPWVNFGSFQLKGGICDAFITKFDSKGKCLWAKKMDAGMSRANSIAIDASGYLYVTGYFSLTAELGNSTLRAKNDGSFDIYVAKFDSNGKCLWAQQAGSKDKYANCMGESISIDAGGNSYITGSFEGTANFGTVQLINHGKRDIFVAKYDPNGNRLWAKSAGGKFDDGGEGISVDSDGNSFVAGTFFGSVEFDTLILNKENFARGNNMFIAKYDTYGNRIWVKYIGSDESCNSIASDVKRNLYVIGKYMDYFYPAKFGTALISGSGSFISKLNSERAAIEIALDSIPLEYSAQIDYPLPSIPGVEIKFDLPYNSLIDVSIYDTTGKYISYIFDKNLKKGIYHANFYGYGLPDGKYNYKIYLTSHDDKHKFETHKEIFLKKLISPGLNYQWGNGPVPFEIKLSFRQIVRYIKDNNAKEISNLIFYPLARPYPLKEIKDTKEFISYYPVIFDAAFIKKLNEYDDSQITEADGLFGLTGGPFKGDIWIGYDRKIYSINYLSAREKTLKSEAINKIKSQMYPGIRDWNDNIIFAKAGKLLIRIDTTDKGLRYVSWSKGNKMSDKPDLILFNGIKSEKSDTAGLTYTFVNENWKYIVEYVEPDNSNVYSDDTDDDSGWYLRLLYNNVQKNSIKLMRLL
ncbi:MAG: SBBP repeat-containing protein [Ignavibacteriaceae bacterium]|nr:SBBP repeat-containing protein [Ignavibacteriaceae bacterium]